jgi:hypothetical protein
VASVSRLIGYLDSTAKRQRWQEAHLQQSPPGVQIVAQTHERRSHGAAFRISLLELVTGCWSLASQHLYVAGGCPTVPIADFPGRLSLFFRAASLAEALAGCLHFLGLSGFLSAAYHHWHPLYSNRSAKLATVYYQQIAIRNA